MEYFSFFFELFITTLGIFLGLVFSFYVLWPKIENYILKLNALNERKDIAKDKLQLRFAAYERLLLLVHRISPQQVMLRNHEPNLSISEFKQRLIVDIENEFQHNYTQQLYVSDAAWTVVKDLKESTIVLFRNVNNIVAETAHIDEYIDLVFKHLRNVEVNPYDAAQIILKSELSA